MARRRRPAAPARRPARPHQADVAIVGAGFTGPLDGLLPEARRPGPAGASCWRPSTPASAPPGATAAGSRASSRALPERTSGAGPRAATSPCSGRCSTPSTRSPPCSTAGDRRRAVRGGRLTVAIDARAARAAARAARRGAGRRRRRGRPARAVRAPSSRAGARRRRARRELLAARRARAPGQLLVGLADAVEALGVEIYERTPVDRDRAAPRRRPSAARSMRAGSCARPRATRASLRGPRRALVPMNSSMIVTEPLPAAAWGEIGWERPRDDRRRRPRLRLPAAHRRRPHRDRRPRRALPLRLAHRPRGESARADVARAARDARARCSRRPPASEIAHAWSGVLGVPRDWCAAVGADPAQRARACPAATSGEGVAAVEPRRRACCATCCSARAPS